MFRVTPYLVLTALLVSAPDPVAGADEASAPADQRAEPAVDWSRILRVRPRWPTGEPLIIYGNCPTRLESVTITPKLDGSRPLEMYSDFGTCGTIAMAAHEEWSHHVAGTLSPDATSVSFEIRITPKSGYTLRPGEREEQIVSLPIEMVATKAEAMTPVESTGAEIMIWNGLSLYVTADDYIGARINQFDLDPAVLDRLAAPIVVEVCDGSAAVRHEIRLNLNKRGYSSDTSPVCFEPPTPSDAEHWFVRVRGDVDAAFEMVRFEEYWGGEVRIPYLEAFQRQPAPVLR